MTTIRTAVDHNDILQGDVVILKHTFLHGKELKTKCSGCGEMFPASYRRMGQVGTARGMEVRNVPRCLKCRGQYRKDKHRVRAEGVVKACGVVYLGPSYPEHHGHVCGKEPGHEGEMHRAWVDGVPILWWTEEEKAAIRENRLHKERT